MNDLTFDPGLAALVILAILGITFLLTRHDSSPNSRVQKSKGTFRSSSLLGKVEIEDEREYLDVSAKQPADTYAKSEPDQTSEHKGEIASRARVIKSRVVNNKIKGKGDIAGGAEIHNSDVSGNKVEN